MRKVLFTVILAALVAFAAPAMADTPVESSSSLDVCEKCGQPIPSSTIGRLWHNAKCPIRNPWGKLTNR